jgi:hypothetical protein
MEPACVPLNIEAGYCILAGQPLYAKQFGANPKISKMFIPTN